MSLCLYHIKCEPDCIGRCDASIEHALTVQPVTTALITLAHNLGIAGALCRAFLLGQSYGYQSCCCGRGFDPDRQDDINERYFRPGCGRVAWGGV